MKFARFEEYLVFVALAVLGVLFFAILGTKKTRFSDWLETKEVNALWAFGLPALVATIMFIAIISIYRPITAILFPQ